jgi:hypothetical protein
MYTTGLGAERIVPGTVVRAGNRLAAEPTNAVKRFTARGGGGCDKITGAWHQKVVQHSSNEEFAA